MPNRKNGKTRQKKPTVSIIGSGRLGMAMAMALDSTGYRITSLVGRRRPQVRKAATLLNLKLETLVAEDFDKYDAAELILVAVPDDRISEVAKALDRIQIVGQPTVLHTSGALSSALFANLAGKGWHTGSIHPLASISNPVTGVEALRNAYWCIEGDTKATRIARRIVRDLGARSFSIGAKDKPLYHAAAVMTSGNVVALFDVAMDMLERCGLSRREAQKILLPLLQSTAMNLSHAEPRNALTGTFARGDLSTVKLHLASLQEKGLDEGLELYRLLGKHALDLTGRKIDRTIVEEIRRRLRDSGR